ncbi:unnamed protein product [Calicophoron daubneyi]|uniref:DUF7041 domain-containing protein n=1 Tax=Calicophoron daubneyi TaxID=300641 RepID=A0AAV2TBY7_CALDB
MSQSKINSGEEDGRQLSAVRLVGRPLTTPLSLPVPSFGDLNVYLWFTIFESQLDCYKIRLDKDKYNELLALLPAEVLMRLRDVIMTQIPLYAASNTRYDVLKAAVSKAFAPSPEAIHRLKLGDKTPSQLLNEMRSLSGPQIVEDALRRLWLQQLPPMTQAIIVANPRLTLDEAASAADNIAQCTAETSIPLVADCRLSPIDIVSQPSHERDRSAPRPILGQEARVPTAPRDDAFDHASMLQALIAEVAAIRSDLQRWQQFRTPTLHQRPRLPNQSQRPPPTPQTSLDEACWYHQQFGDAARRCTPWCTYKKTRKNYPASGGDGRRS